MFGEKRISRQADNLRLSRQLSKKTNRNLIKELLFTQILMEGIVFCFILLVFCVVGIANGPERFIVFYEKDVQDRSIELGYNTREEITVMR